MIIKRYIVNNMNEAMVRIKYELGMEALIISQRKIRKPGLKGLFSKKVIEVTAAVDNDKPKDKSEVTDSIMKEMKDMKEMLSSVIESTNKEDFSENEISSLLKSCDLNEKNIAKIMAKLSTVKENIDKREKLKFVLKDMVKVSPDLKSKVIILVGPTGVGKTTTIAKLAGKYSQYEKLKVGLITIDTYRIGAVDQLKTYAEIMNLPFKVVMNIKEMQSAVNSMKECDVILIDTTGRNSKNFMHISELKAYISKVKSDSVNLVMSCTTKNSDIDVITNGYKELNFDSIIITKLDETSTYGSILNILESSGKPLSYVTTGQNVPDDIKLMTPDEISNIILGADEVCLIKQNSKATNKKINFKGVDEICLIKQKN